MQTTFDKRQNNIDFFRLFLALMVVFAHSYAIVGVDRQEPMWRLTRGQAGSGNIAVDVFFILSGFLISASYERSDSVWSFLKKRLARIYPAFLVLTLLTALIVVPMSGGHLAGKNALTKAALVLSSALRLKDIKAVGAFSTNSFPGVVNASLWSVSYEFLCYLGVCLLGATGLLRNRAALGWMFAASILVSVVFAHFGWHSEYSWKGALLGYPQYWARMLPMYLAGVVFYRFRHAFVLRTWGLAVSLLALAASCFLPHGYLLLFPIFGTHVVMAFCFYEGAPFHRRMRFGDFSYGSYLFAFPIQQIVAQRAGVLGSPMLLFAIVLPLLLSTAAVSWFAVERPVLRLVRNGPKQRQRLLVAATAPENI